MVSVTELETDSQAQKQNQQNRRRTKSVHRQEENTHANEKFNKNDSKILLKKED